MDLKRTPASVRVMTYNVHSCRGLDGRIDPCRISKVIKEYDPDIVALQELDVNRRSSKYTDQPAVIAGDLRMSCHFQPAIALEGEHYGITILSRYPLEIVKAGHLSETSRSAALRRVPVIKYLYEPREVIWAKVRIGERGINFINTHLGLRATERIRHVKDILSDRWLGSIDEDTATIFCGDFNTGPGSSVYQMLQDRFKEVKQDLPVRARKTFFSYCPLAELDHMFYKGNVTLRSVRIPSTGSTRMASDHLPIVADFNL